MATKPDEAIRGLVERLRAGLEGVTPGPWRLDVPDRGYCMNYVVTEAPGYERDQNGYRRDIIADCDDCKRGEANAAHIANCSPENIAVLLDALASLRGRVEELTRERDRLNHAVEFAAKMCWRTDPPNANNKFTEAERLDCIKHHPTIKKSGAPHRELAEREAQS